MAFCTSTGPICSLLFLTIFFRAIELFYFVQNTGNNEGLNFDKYIYYPTHTRLSGLIFGIFLSFCKNYYKNIWFKLTEFKYSNFYLIAGLLGIFTCEKLFHIDNLRIFNAIFGDTIFAISCFLLVLSALSVNSFLYKAKIPGATKIATWSYAIYLTHKIFIYLTFQFFLNHFKSYNESFFCVLSAIIISVFGGWLLYRMVELPFLNIRDQLTRKGL